jgi:hypothetical protein
MFQIHATPINTLTQSITATGSVVQRTELIHPHVDDYFSSVRRRFQLNVEIRTKLNLLS